MLDDFSRYIIAWKLRTGMAASDVQDTLNLALEASGLENANVVHRPRLLSDNGPSYISGDLAEYLADKGMKHEREKIKKRTMKLRRFQDADSAAYHDPRCAKPSLSQAASCLKTPDDGNYKALSFLARIPESPLSPGTMGFKRS